jgi:AraC family transcriptional regulator
MKIDIVERQPVRVACLRYTGPGGELLGRFWRGTVSPWLADHGLVDCPRYGVIIDDPARTPPATCRYDACIELPPGLPLPDATEAIIRGGRYAITCFKGPRAELAVAWGAFGAAVLADLPGRVDESRPAFEHMPRGALCDVRTGVICCELCLPVAS